VLENKVEDNVKVPINTPLFAWVIENLCRNAMDAMEGAGIITVRLSREMDKVLIDVEDTGKGIPSGKFETVFQPGYTSKKRGWGLGLSLTRRIVEHYHGGRIWVLRSELGQGTTFRITLNLHNGK
jgi:signal transduction histidine kinase